MSEHDQESGSTRFRTSESTSCRHRKKKEEESTNSRFHVRVKQTFILHRSESSSLLIVSGKDRIERVSYSVPLFKMIFPS